MRQFTAGILGCIVLSACTLSVQDRTAGPLVYNDPTNSQTLAVEVLSSRTILGVEATGDGIGSVEMVAVGGDIYQAVLDFPSCAEVAQFSVEIETEGVISRVRRKTFPEIGQYTHGISDRPRECRFEDDGPSDRFLVTTTEDFVDASPGDGTCAGITEAVAVRCSLRAAIMEANAKQGSDLIILPSGRYLLTLENESGSRESEHGINDAVYDLDITDDLTIQGQVEDGIKLLDFTEYASVGPREAPRIVIRDDPETDDRFPKIVGVDTRAFQIHGEETEVRMSHLAIVASNHNDGDQRNWVDNVGGGIDNRGQLYLYRTALIDNIASGGAIYNEGQLIVEETAFLLNYAAGATALLNKGSATLRRSLIAYNSGDSAVATNTFISGVPDTITLVQTHLENTSLLDNLTGLGSVDNGRGAETSLVHVTVADGVSSHPRAMLWASRGSEFTINSVLLLRWPDFEEPYCTGPIKTIGGNLSPGPCDVTGTPLGPDNFNFGEISWPRVPVDRGGFLPVIVTGRTSDRGSVLDLGLDIASPATDQRGVGFPRSVDGDGDGVATPDAGAYEREAE